MMKIISWNLLRQTGATLGEIERLVARHRPDLLLMQEATATIDQLPARLGGFYHRNPLPGRIHGLAMWSPRQLPHQPLAIPLPSGPLYHRICQILDLGPFAVANVHLSHGQMMNRRQLRRIAEHLPHHAAVLGDYNLVGPALLPGFRDVGPRRITHMAQKVVPFRLDRCMVRGLACMENDVLSQESSDHRAILVRLKIAESKTGHPPVSAVTMAV
jgi:endonuclease/exonuclease/phosphatase (EEP) superfamily protein YafD